MVPKLLTCSLTEGLALVPELLHELGVGEAEREERVHVHGELVVARLPAGGQLGPRAPTLERRLRRPGGRRHVCCARKTHNF